MKTKKEQSAAILTIKSPGKMSKKGRRDIAKWLERQAKNLLADGDKYTDGRFTARYLY
jgi:hypothetical protein